MASASNHARLVRVPNSDCWIETFSVVAVIRLPDSTTESKHDKPGQTATKITHTNFKLSMSNGKDITVQHHDRDILKKFLQDIGVAWEG